MCEHDPVEQTRGRMGHGDYFDVMTNALDDTKLARPSEDFWQDIEIDDSNKSDMRILCKKCFLSTGWMKVDFPGAPAGIGVSAVRSKWDEIKHHNPESYNAALRASGRRTTIRTFEGLQ
jgi:hypothetical protein